MADRFKRLIRSPLWLEILIVGLWIGLLVHANTRFSTSDASRGEGMELLTAAGEGEGAEWVGVYLEGQKIGCGLLDRVKTESGYRIQERTYLKLRAFEQDREITTVFVADTDEQQRLRSFIFLLSAPPSQIDVRGQVRGQSLKLEIHSGGGVQHQSIPLTEVPDIALTFKEKVVRQHPSIGQVLEIPYFDPATLSKQTLSVEVTGMGTALVNGVSLKTYVLEASYHGFKTTAVVTEDGRTLEETNAIGMKLKREAREEAIYEGWGDREASVDIIALSAVPLSRPIPNARQTVYLDVNLSGGGVEVLLGRPDDGAMPGDVLVKIPARDQWRPYRIPMVDARFESELASTSLIQADDPKIRRVAQSILGDVTRADDAAALLNSWVFQRLTKTPVMGVPSALETLRTGVGDCNEHTTLFTALARSVGIPTRMAAGIVYSEQVGVGPAFYYHAWPEIYLGEWIPVDPTFGQYPADATHIKLVEGDLEEQLALLRVVGNLSITVRESH